MDPQVQDCSSNTHWKKTFPDLDYSLLGYDIIYGYPLANGRDPGSRHPIFMADYSKPKQTSDCRFVVPSGFTTVPSESRVVSFESKLVRNKQEMSEHLGIQANVEGNLNVLGYNLIAFKNSNLCKVGDGQRPLKISSDAQRENKL